MLLPLRLHALVVTEKLPFNASIIKISVKCKRKRIAIFVKMAILFYGEGGFARSAERARSAGKRAPGTFSLHEQFIIFALQHKRKNPSHKMGTAQSKACKMTGR